MVFGGWRRSVDFSQRRGRPARPRRDREPFRRPPDEALVRLRTTSRVMPICIAWQARFGRNFAVNQQRRKDGYARNPLPPLPYPTAS